MQITDIEDLDSNLQTLCWSVINVISGFIPSEINLNNLSFQINSKFGWTRYGVKPDGTQYELSDSARYKLCGNGVVVNVVKAIINNF